MSNSDYSDYKVSLFQYLWMVCLWLFVFIFLIIRGNEVKRLNQTLKERDNIMILKDEVVKRGFAQYRVEGGTNIIFEWVGDITNFSNSLYSNK